MSFWRTVPGLSALVTSGWGVARGQRVDIRPVSWADVAAGMLRSQDVGEPPPLRGGPDREVRAFDLSKATLGRKCGLIEPETRRPTSSALPGRCDGGDVAVVCAAATADDVQARQFVAKRHVTARQVVGVALVEFDHLVELGVAEC